jgi:hypothetical protein
MNWVGEYIIEASGLCRWTEGIEISDPALLKACRQDLPTYALVYSLMQLGVKVGVA